MELLTGGGPNVRSPPRSIAPGSRRAGRGMADENGSFEIGGRLHKLPQQGKSLNVCLERGVFYTSAPDVARHAGPCCVLSPWLQGRPSLTLFVLLAAGEYVVRLVRVA